VAASGTRRFALSPSPLLPPTELRTVQQMHMPPRGGGVESASIAIASGKQFAMQQETIEFA